MFNSQELHSHCCMGKDIPVSEVMFTDLAVVDPEVSVQDGATLMTDKGIGCLIIVKDAEPLGIVTERDIIRKVISSKKDPAGVTLKEIMSSPVKTIPPDIEIFNAAKKMAKMKVRRLLVMKENVPIGVVNEHNILSMAPHIIEYLKEVRDIEYLPSLKTEIMKIPGYCESCKAYSDILDNFDGQLICPECKEGRS